MKSPFPGMDPYLERHWGDVHSRLVLYSCDQIQQRLPKDLVARVEERLVVEPATETFINILEPATDHRLITVIEFLSRSNKFTGEGQQQYRQKQTELKRAKVSLVEIDLVRSGKRVFSLPAARIPRKHRTTYQACVRRGWRLTACEIYPMPLRSPLPVLRIPLRRKDNDVALALQPVVDEAYAKGAYGKTINYREAPEPSLAEEDAKWADALLQQAGKR